MAKYISTTIAKGKRYHYFNPPAHYAAVGIKSRRLSDDNYEAEAEALVAQIESGTLSLDRERARRHLAEVFRKARARATERGLPFTITMTDVIDRLEAAEYRCSVSGAPLSLDPKTVGYRAPFRPSIDRIDARRGYEPDNIRIVCVAVNAAMSDWGEEVFWTVVRFASGKSTQNKTASRSAKPLRNRSSTPEEIA